MSSQGATAMLLAESRASMPPPRVCMIPAMLLFHSVCAADADDGTARAGERATGAYNRGRGREMSAPHGVDRRCRPPCSMVCMYYTRAPILSVAACVDMEVAPLRGRKLVSGLIT
jgi:hypothetical protein